jgi:hypothetical protein
VKAERKADPAPMPPVALDPLERRRQAAEERVREALMCLEQAQGFVGRAATVLCSVGEMEMASRVVWAYCDRLQMVSFGVERRSGSLRVDGRLMLDYTPAMPPAPEGGGR